MTARIHHADLFGTRDSKFQWLNTHDVKDTKWQTVQPQTSLYLFKPQKARFAKEYGSNWAISEISSQANVGIVTGQDKKTIAFERQEGISLAHKLGISPDCVSTVLYRPFDIRVMVYDASVVTRPRTDVMHHMVSGENIGLLYMRQVAVQESYTHFGVTRTLVDNRAFYSNKGILTLAPLYLYPNGELFQDSPWPAGKDGRRPNLSPEFVREFSAKMGLKFVSDGAGDLKNTFGPEDIFHYAYAVFHSPTYRSRYAEFLKVDFPRLPLTSDKAVFACLVKLGRELAGLHLLENVPPPQATYPQAGGNVVTRTGKSAYKPPTSHAPGCVYINDSQYFDNVPPEVWGFHVGGYQVCEKWLKDRKGRTLSYDDIEHYRKVTEALRQTLRLMAEIDQAIPTWPLE